MENLVVVVHVAAVVTSVVLLLICPFSVMTKRFDASDRGDSFPAGE